MHMQELMRCVAGKEAAATAEGEPRAVNTHAAPLLLRSETYLLLVLLLQCSVRLFLPEMLWM
jgi:hypothetical protein